MKSVENIFEREFWKIKNFISKPTNKTSRDGVASCFSEAHVVRTLLIRTSFTAMRKLARVQSKKKKKEIHKLFFHLQNCLKKENPHPTHTRSSKYTHTYCASRFSVFPSDMTSDWINKWHIHTVNVHSPRKKKTGNVRTGNPSLVKIKSRWWKKFQKNRVYTTRSKKLTVIMRDIQCRSWVVRTR